MIGRVSHSDQKGFSTCEGTRRPQPPLLSESHGCPPSSASLAQSPASCQKNQSVLPWNYIKACTLHTHQKKLKSKALLEDHAVCFCCFCCSCLIDSARHTKRAMWTFNGRQKRKTCLRTKQCSVFSAKVCWFSPLTEVNILLWQHAVLTLSRCVFGCVLFCVTFNYTCGVLIINPSGLERAK